jgi:hypothetical protein
METDLNKRICAAIKDRDPRRCENTVDPGTPDIHYVNGWIEDKQVRFPSTPGLIIKVDHYHSGQRGWQVRRRRAGGLCHVAIEDSRTGWCYVFDALDAAQHLGIDWTERDMRMFASYFSKRWDGRAFREWLLSCKP